MAGGLLDWLDDRTGYRGLLSSMLLEHVPGGARWRYVWGSTLVFVFSLQLITGLLLMTSYSPSDNTAWASVHYIQYQMDFGWLIRGLHHFGSQTMMVLIALHMLQVVLAGAQLPPREFNWWLGIGLLALTFGLSLTGYLLPWDQKGYWATRVATSIASNLPGGDFLRRIIIGGPDFGNHTLTRFFALHVGILPLLLMILLVFHIALFRRHGVTAPANAVGMDTFWPRQVFRDWIACLVVFAVMLMAVLGVFGPHGHNVADHDWDPTSLNDWAHAGQFGLGANLDAPADRDTAGYPARPEWYFLFLFQLLKYFEGDLVIVGTVLIPNGALALLTALPLFGYGWMRPIGYWFGVLVMVSLLLGAIGLTLLAFASDSPEWAPKAVGWLGGDEAAQKKAEAEAKGFQDKVEHAEYLAGRAAKMALSGVPENGPRALLRNDPLTRGRELFKTHCAACHRFTPRPDDPFEGFTNGKYKASDLGDFGSAAWVRGLLKDPDDPHYFGLTSLEGMKGWKKTVLRKRKRMSDDKIAQQEKDFDTIAQWLGEQSRPPEKRDKGLDVRARPLFEDHCAACHRFGKEGGDTAPDLTGFGSAEYIRGMIMAPGQPSRYGALYKEADKKGLMPAFRPQEGADAQIRMHEFRAANPDMPPNLVLGLSDVEREMIIRFLMRDPYAVFGGVPISDSSKQRQQERHKE